MKENAPTEHKNNWPGTRIGHLTVMDATDQRKGGYTVWRCRCDCGNEILLDTRALQRQAITDCGCITKVKPGQKDMTGQRFGKLVCLYPERDKSKNGSSVWRCRCDCGNECSTTRRQLICGYKKSCGCSAHPPEKEYTGQKFGRLTVLGYAGKKSGQRMWKCRCDCGNICTVRQTKLQSGLTVSCGCYNAEKYKESQKNVDGTRISLLETVLSGKLRATNTSGHTGVSFHKRTGKWRASITFQGKDHYLGEYEEKADAIKARERAEDMFRDFLRGLREEVPERDA